MVLHDLPNGAMRHLDRVLGGWQDAGVEFLEQPPEACVPMRAGVPKASLSQVMSPDPAP
jgi:hypothetical protein